MALGPIPSWENQPDYLGAMSQGAKLGLDRASLEEQAKSAADRLRLGYAELAQKGASEAAAQSAAAQLHAAVRADSMAQFQQEQELKREQMAQQAGIKQQAAQQLQQYREDTLGLKKQNAEKDKVVNVHGALYRVDKDGNLQTLVPPEARVDPIDNIQLRKLEADMRSLKAQIGSARAHEQDDLVKQLQDQHDRAEKAFNAILGRYQPKGDQSSAAPAPSAAAQLNAAGPPSIPSMPDSSTVDYGSPDASDSGGVRVLSIRPKE